MSYSAAGSLPGGSYTTTYQKETLRPISVLGDGFQTDTSYSLTGKPLQYALGSTGGGKKTWATNTYEWGTQRLATSRVDRQDQPGVDQLDTYGYDQAGNILSVSDVSRTGTDTQCFTYDYLRRMTEAWTQGDKACATAPAGDKTGGPAPYWHSYTYDKAGNRLTETLHDTSGDSSKNTQRDYEYPKPGDPQPHTLTSVTTHLPGGTATQDSYGYDETGNTLTRTLRGDAQTLAWDAEGHLAKVTEPVEGEKDKVTEYVYDTEGNRLIARTPTESTLYLGHTEVTLPTGAAKAKATRYTPLGGGHQAVKEDNGAVTFTTADHQGTGQLSIKANDLALTQRRTLPFGGPRGEAPKSWPGTKGFVGGTDDTKSTGLTHLGAREYDPTTGRFISVDPIMDLTNPQQINGYTYSSNNPLTFSDPTGLKECAGDYCRPDEDWIDRHGDYHKGNKKKGTVTSKGSGGGGGYRGGGGGGYRGGGGGYSGPQPSPSANPAPVPGPYPDANDRVLDFLSVVWIVAAPDIDAWKGCWNEQGVGDCASALGDMPTPAKALKLLKLRKLKEGEEAAEAVGKSKKGVPSGCKCFVAGTGVLMADGTSKNIEDVELGDKVLATDPKTGETSKREVTATIVTEDDKQFTELTLATPDGSEKLTTTYEHPFWSVDQKDWVEAGDLKPGMTLRTDDGRTVTVRATRQYEDRQRTHNLTIAGLHTYYVLAGQTPVLVHNSNCPLTGGFKVGVSRDEIADINRGFGGETLLSGSPANTLANASRYNSFWDKSAVVIRDIAGSHMFNNGNKRTAQATDEQLMQRNGVTSGPNSADLRSVIDRVGKGQLHDVSDISAALRGY
ncbi:polymorphic toxin-type HINT domain-containing protein [Streptomyces sp. NPDC055239]